MKYFLLSSVCVNMALDVVFLVFFFTFKLLLKNFLIKKRFCSSVYTSGGSGPYRKELQGPPF